MTQTTVLTPDACAGCHGEIVEQNQRSHHAEAAKFIGSLDNVLGEVVEGRLAAVNGCWQCHGSTVAFLKNPDGSIRKNAVGAPKSPERKRPAFAGRGMRRRPFPGGAPP